MKNNKVRDKVNKDGNTSCHDFAVKQQSTLEKNTTDHVPCHCCKSRCNARKSCLCKKKSQFCTVDCYPGHSCVNCKKDSDIPQVIDLSDTKTTVQETPAPHPWKCIKWITLTECEKAILTTPGEWLGDNLINAAQVLLK